MFHRFNLGKVFIPCAFAAWRHSDHCWGTEGCSRVTFPKVLDQRPPSRPAQRGSERLSDDAAIAHIPCDTGMGSSIIHTAKIDTEQKNSVVYCFPKILLFWKNLELGAYLRGCICSALWFVGAGESHRISIMTRERSIWKELFQHSHSLRKTTQSKLRWRNYNLCS